ncbi:hypothetical protein DYBT9275_00116 [Dyadobacter sp. CECT 9275]|uniref:Gingipain domain-containing protein n=1 Tax=Dyadobacter helix TaxID=2822344 RepID=A0A916J7R8_9BACT|nr:type IX secretion system sortase PorU [Dyadobacter sp. CECT 9275]CAG4988585.1 hypothetical protein DYBT9275_00116 [Dyadobacter sp. CECT 9275]
MHWLKHADFKNYFALCLILCCGLLQVQKVYAQESAVLAKDKWVKIGITETGVYKLDISLLRRMGISGGKIAASGIRIFGNGGAMLPQSNSTPRTAGLTENAVWIEGGDDGTFDETDAVYFYGEGPHVIVPDTVNVELHHQINCYSDTSYYFLTYGDTPGLRIGAAETVSSTGQVVDSFDDYWYHEEETYNLLRSGRVWFGEYLGTSALNFPVNISGVLPSSTVKFFASGIGAAQVATRFSWLFNGQQIGEGAVGTVTSQLADQYALRAQRTTGSFSAVLPASLPAAFTAGVSYIRNGQSSAQAYLDYLALQIKRELRPYDNQQIYRFLSAEASLATFRIKNISASWKLWDISNSARPAQLVNNENGTKDITLASKRRFRQWIGFTFSQALTPASWTLTGNQGIHQDTEEIDLLMVTAPAFITEAERLAAFRRDHDGLKVKVVTTYQVYNEYASGKPDLTAIRDFARHIYKMGRGKLRYLLLFGDATYDYRNKLQNQTADQRKSWVPVYESRESLNPVYTYSSDDYYGFLDDAEGEWIESAAGDHQLDIGIGRLPVKNLTEARTVVNKLIHYASAEARKSWKNTVRFVADDGDGNVHQQHADQLAQLIGDRFLAKRIFLDEFPQVTTSQGQKSAEVNAQIKKTINNGSLILNYTGHGGVNGWAEEQILTLADMLSVHGYDNMPLLVTATCDFGRYDDMGQVSGAELMVLSPKGAAIGALSTTRPVYSSTNYTLNKALYESLRIKMQGQRMGNVVKSTKNNALVGSLNRNFTFLGDPSMLLTENERYINWSMEPDTLLALRKVKLKGGIFYTKDSLPDSDFNGTANIAIYDKPVSFQTLGNEGSRQSYSEFRNKLFEGVVTVVNGSFVCEFVVPKDINYQFGVGRASIYASNIKGTADVSDQLDLIIGGSDQMAVDEKPPVISAYLNDPSFRDGDQVPASSDLMIKLSDENGINVSASGVGHNITAVINDTLEINLNDYYSSELDDFTKGTIYYPFENLKPGKYTVRIKVWDTYTNYSEITFGFLVGAASGIVIEELKIYPNPFQSDLSFQLEHNRENEDIEVDFKVLSISGQTLGSERWTYYNSEKEIAEKVTSGALTTNLYYLNAYLYVIEIRSLKDNSVDRKSGRLLRSP